MEAITHTSSNVRKCFKKSKIQNLKNQKLLLGTKQAPCYSVSSLLDNTNHKFTYLDT